MSLKSKSRILKIPLEFANPVIFATQTLELEPDPAQLNLLESNPHRLLLNCSRQWGKSTITAAKAVHQALFTSESLILVLTPSARQSAEFLRKAAAYLRKLNIPERGDGDNEISLLLPNNSRIIGLPGKDATIRGFSAVSLLLIDEAARVPDELYLAVRPMLAASNGQLWLMSTPNGCRGFFYEAWSGSDSNWTRISVPATECPRIAPAFLEDERRSTPIRHFEQEYLCHFHDAEDSVFSHETLTKALAPIPPLHLNSAVNPLHPCPPHNPISARYYIGVDLGQKQDYTAIAIIERAVCICGPRDRVNFEFPTEIVYSVRHLERLPLGTSYPDIVSHIRAIARHPALGDSRELIVDATGVGQPVVDMLRRVELGCRLTPVTLTSGGQANHHGGNWRVPRHELLVKLEIALQQEQLKISSLLAAAPVLVQELQSLRRKIKDTGRDSIHPWRDSQHDDFVFAAALAHWRATLFPRML